MQQRHVPVDSHHQNPTHTQAIVPVDPYTIPASAAITGALQNQDQL